MSKARGGPTYSGVQWADVSQALEEYQRDYEGGVAYVMLRPNGLGVFELTVECYYSRGQCEWLAQTVEPWSESKGRLQAFVYRSILDTIKEVDYQLARPQDDDSGHE